MKDVNRLLRLEKEAEKAINQAQNTEEIKILKLKYLGRKSELVLFLKNLKGLEAPRVVPFSVFAEKVRNRIYLLIRQKEAEL